VSYDPLKRKKRNTDERQAAGTEKKKEHRLERQAAFTEKREISDAIH
jgi:hypothetical protein